MIYTVTLNPAIDKTIYIKSLSKDQVNRVTKSYKDPAGKGINVSKVLHSLGTESQILTIIAGSAGDYIKNELQMNHRFLYEQVDGLTRTNMKVIDAENDDVYEINESGPVVEQTSVFKLFNQLRLTKKDIVVLAGSVPAGLPTDIYANLIRNLKDEGVYVVLDTSNQLLIEGAKGNPNVIKPNKDEIETILKTKYNSVEELIADKKRILSLGAENVIVSLGGDGSVFISKEKVYRVEGIKVKAMSTVGAGDSFVSGFVHGMSLGLSIPECLRWGTAVATEAVTTASTQPGDVSRVKELYEKVIVKEME